MYAIVRSGGKQYRAEEGRMITVERLPAEEGSTVELGDVLLIADNGEVTVGRPTIEGARVLAQVETQGRGKKIIVFKYKSKVRSRKKTGHRQYFTRLTVQEILRPGQESKEAEKPKRRTRRKAAEEDSAEAKLEEVAVSTPEAAAAEEEAEAPAPKRRTRRKAAEPAVAEATTAEVPATKRRTRRKAAGEGTPEATAPDASAEEAPKPRRRTSRKPTEESIAEAPATGEASTAGGRAKGKAADEGTSEAAPPEEADKPKTTRRRTSRRTTEEKTE